MKRQHVKIRKAERQKCSNKFLEKMREIRFALSQGQPKIFLTASHPPGGLEYNKLIYFGLDQNKHCACAVKNLVPVPWYWRSKLFR